MFDVRGENIKFKKISFILLILLILISIGAASASDDFSNNNITQSATDSVVLGDNIQDVSIYVDVNGNDNNIGSKESPYATIDKAISSVNASKNTTIYLGQGTFAGEKNVNLIIGLDNLKNNSTLTFIGLGSDKTIIDGEYMNPIFNEIKGDSIVILKDISLINGKNNFGGAITNNGDLTIESCKFINNYATGNVAGVIYQNSKNNLHIKDSYFCNNSAGGYGGVIYGDFNYFELQNNIFINNSIRGSYGDGALADVYVYKVLKINNNKFINTTSGSRASDASFSLNVASIEEGNECTFTNNQFINCTTTSTSAATTTLIGNINFRNNTYINSNNAKGNIYIKSGSITYKIIVLNNETINVDSPTFTLTAIVTDDMGNSVSGGSIDFLLNGTKLTTASIDGGKVSTTITKELDNGVFVVSAKGYGNDIVTTATMVVNIYKEPIDLYVSTDGHDDTGDGSKDNPFLTISKAIDYGFEKTLYPVVHIAQGVYIGEGNTKISKSNFGTLTIIGEMYNKTIIDGERSNWFFNFGSYTRVNLINLSFVNGYNSGYSPSGLIYVSGENFTIKDVIIDSSVKGRAAVSMDNYVNLNVDNLTFTNNNCTFQFADNSIVKNSYFANNVNNNNQKNGAALAGVYESSKITVLNSVFINNRNTYIYTNWQGEDFEYSGQGAAIFSGGVKSINNTYINNYAIRDGAIKGLIYSENDQFINNSAIEYGVFESSTSVETINGTSFYKNLIIKNSKFINNSANHVGVGALIGAIITNTEFINNSANDTAVLYIKAHSKNYNVNPVSINNSTFINNKDKTETDIYVEESAGTLLANTITGLKITFNDKNITQLSDDLVVTVYCNGAKITGGTVKFYINGTYVGTSKLTSGEAKFTYVGFKNGKYIGSSEFSISNNDTIYQNGTLMVSISSVLDKIDLYVSSVNGSDIDGDGSLNNPFKSISFALDYAFKKSTDIFIHVLEGTYSGNLNTNLSLPNTVSINIIGAGVNKTIIDGENLNYFAKVLTGFNATSISDITFYNLTTSYLTYKKQVALQSPISIENGAKLNINNCEFIACHGNSGGAIRNNGNLNIINSYFFNNGDANEGGAIYNDVNAYLTIDNSTFVANHAKYGSTIYNLGILKLSNSEIRDSIRTDGWTGNCAVIDGASVNNNLVGETTIINSKIWATGKTPVEIIGKGQTYADKGDTCVGVSGQNSIIMVNSTVIGTSTAKGSTSMTVNRNVAIGGAGSIPKPFNEAKIYNSTFKNLNIVCLNPQKSVLFDGCIFENYETLLSSSANANTSSVFNNSILLSPVSILINDKTSYSLDNNWWLNNTPTFNVKNQATPLKPNTWVILTINGSNDGSVILGLNKITDGNNTYDYLGKLPVREFTLDVNDGVISPNKGNLVNNEIIAYVSGHFGQFNVTGKVDNVSVSTTTNLTNIVTNGTFFIFFDEYGNLRDTLPFNNLTFVGDFEGLGISAAVIDRTISLNGNNATFKDFGFNLVGDNIAVNGFNINSNDYGILASGENITLSNNTVNVIGDLDKDAYGIYAMDCPNLNIINNTVNYVGNTNGTGKNYAVYITGADGLIMKNNALDINIPSAAVSYDPVTYAASYIAMGIYVENSKDASVDSNMITADYNNVVGYYDTIYVLDVNSCDNAIIRNNTVIANGNSYIYGITVDNANNFSIDSNDVKITGVYYANGVQVNGPSVGIVDSNNVSAIADSVVYPIYSAGWNGPVVVNYTNNNVYGKANSVYAFEIGGQNESIVSNVIVADGNFTLGIASSAKFANISNNNMTLNGLGLGKPSSGDSIASENVGIKTTNYANVAVSGNNITTTGEFTVNLGKSTDNSVIDNYLVSKSLTGDASVSAADKNTVANNIPTMFKTILADNNLVMYYKNGSKYIITLTTKDGVALANKEIVIRLDGYDYKRITDSNGTVSMPINLRPGVFDVSISFAGDNSSAPSTLNSSFVVKSTIMGNDLVKYYLNGSQYQAKFLDNNGNPLVGKTVKFNIDGVFYNRVTDENGIATLNINLRPCELIVTAIHPDNGQMFSNNVTVKSTIMGNDLVKYYRNGSQYQAKFVDGMGNPLVGKTVKFNIDGVFYERTTDENGIATLNINLRPGTFVITAIHPDNGQMFSNKITVLSTIVSKDLEMVQGDGSKFSVTVLDDMGRPAAGKNVSFNIDGVFYNRVSDENGIASLPINLRAGNFIVSSEYNGLVTSNKIVIKQ